MMIVSSPLAGRAKRWTVLLVVAGLTLGLAPSEQVAIELPDPLDLGLETVVQDQLLQLKEIAIEAVRDEARSDSERAEAVGELGRHYHAYGLTAAARACYELAARFAPRDFRWPYLLGYLAQSDGRLDEAVGYYEKALAIVPGVSPALIRLAASYSELGNPDKAEWLYREALRADPTSAAAEAGLGELLLSLDRPEEAVELLEGALEKAGEANRLYYPLALAYRKLGNEEQARQLLAWRGNVGIKPADPLIDSLSSLKTGERALLLQGRSAFRVGRYAEAAEKFQQALDTNPDSIPALINLGSAFGLLAQTDAAIAAFERAVELAPGNETALFNLGLLLSRRGDYERAIDYLSQAGRFVPADGQIRYELANALRLAGRFEDSLVHFDAALQALPALEAAWLGKAQSLARMERSAEVHETLELGLDQMPESIVLAEALSRVLAQAQDPQLRDGERAVRIALEIFRVRPELADAEWVGEALAEAGRCEEAAVWQRQVVEQATEAAQPEMVMARLEANLERFEGGAPCNSARKVSE